MGLGSPLRVYAHGPTPSTGILGAQPINRAKVRRVMAWLTVRTGVQQTDIQELWIALRIIL